MTNREHFIATLQACYCGDRNAFEEIIRIYDGKDNIINEVREYVSEIIVDEIYTKCILEILDKVGDEK